jgi:hypothetical protein
MSQSGQLGAFGLLDAGRAKLVDGVVPLTRKVQGMRPTAPPYRRLIFE